MVNGHKSAAHTDSPDGGTGKTCLGGGVHCPTASSCLCLQCSVASAHLESRLHGDDALIRAVHWLVVKQAMLILISRSTPEVTARIRKSNRTSTYEALRARVA